MPSLHRLPWNPWFQNLNIINRSIDHRIFLQIALWLIGLRKHLKLWISSTFVIYGSHLATMDWGRRRFAEQNQSQLCVHGHQIRLENCSISICVSGESRLRRQQPGKCVRTCVWPAGVPNTNTLPSRRRTVVRSIETSWAWQFLLKLWILIFISPEFKFSYRCCSKEILLEKP